MHYDLSMQVSGEILCQFVCWGKNNDVSAGVCVCVGGGGVD